VTTRVCSSYYADEDHLYCPCGGRLVGGAAPEGERRYRLVISARLRSTPSYRQLGELLAGEEGIEIIFDAGKTST